MLGTTSRNRKRSKSTTILSKNKTKNTKNKKKYLTRKHRLKNKNGGS